MKVKTIDKILNKMSPAGFWVFMKLPSKARKKVIRLKAIFLMFMLMASPASAWEGYMEFMGKPGTSRNLGQGDLFVPLTQDKNDLTFFNLRGQINADEIDEYEFNIGVGHRHLFENYILGAHAWFDQRETASGNSLNQFTMGIEALSEDFDFRANGYIPDDETNILSTSAKIQNSNNIIITSTAEKALDGFDAEIGYRLPLEKVLPETLFQDVRLFAGGYHFLGNEIFESISGPRARLEMRVHDLPYLGAGSRLMLGVETQYDEVRGNQTSGLASIRIPFGVVSKKTRTPLKGLNRRMVEPIVRDVDIVLNKATKTANPTNVNGSSDFAVVNDGKQLNDALEDQDVIVVNSDLELEDVIILKEGQQLIGGNQEIQMTYKDPFGSGIKTINNKFEFGRGDLSFSGCDGDNPNKISAVTMGTGSMISGMDIDATGCRVGIRVDKKGSYTINNTTIENAQYFGVLVSGEGETGSKDGKRGDTILTINNSIIKNNGTKILKFFGNDNDSNVRGAGLYIHDEAEVIATNLDVDSNGQGITLGKGSYVPPSFSLSKLPGYLTLTGGMVRNSTLYAGIQLHTGSRLTATEVIVSDNASTGIQGVASYLYFSKGIVSGNKDKGIQMVTHSDSNIFGTLVLKNSGDGMVFSGGNSNIANNIISENGGVGAVIISASDVSSKFHTFLDNIVTKNESDGIIVSGGARAKISGGIVSGNFWSGLKVNGLGTTTEVTDVDFIGNGDFGLEIGKESKVIANGLTIKDHHDFNDDGYQGGVVVFDGATLEINDSIVKNNQGAGLAALNLNLGGVIITGKNVIVEDNAGLGGEGHQTERFFGDGLEHSNLPDNDGGSEDFLRGGLFVSGKDSTITLTDSNIRNNGIDRDFKDHDGGRLDKGYGNFVYDQYFDSLRKEGAKRNDNEKGAITIKVGNSSITCDKTKASANVCLSE